MPENFRSIRLVVANVALCLKHMLLSVDGNASTAELAAIVASIADGFIFDHGDVLRAFVCCMYSVCGRYNHG